MKSWIDGAGRIVLLVLCISGLVAAIPTRSAAAAEITTRGDSATLDFPTGIDFSVHIDSPASITSVALLYTLASSKTENYVKPSYTPGANVDASANAPLGADYVPSGIEIHYWWRIENADGATLETPAQSILWKDTRFDWTSVADQNVTIYSYKASSKFQQYLLSVAEKYVASEMKLYGLSTLIPINIWIYDSKADFNGTLAPNSQEWAAGTALPAFQLIQEIISDGDDYEANRLIPHELSHQILHQATDNPFGVLPLWLDEGLAVNNENVDHSRYDSAVAAAKGNGSLVSIKALISEFPIDSNQASLAYAESYSIVKFMRATYGDDKLLALVHAFKAELSIDDALKTAYGFDQDGLQTLWLASIKPSNRASTIGAGLTDLGLNEWASGGMLILLAAGAAAAVKRVRRPRPSHSNFTEPLWTFSDGRLPPMAGEASATKSFHEGQ